MCRDEQRYEIFTCPNGGIFDDQEKACIDLCEQKKPCLNQGQCIILSNLTLQCVCRRDWTGERCETPLSACADNPCGPDAECRMLVASDYPQDYVCICDKEKTYGRNCQQSRLIMWKMHGCNAFVHSSRPESVLGEYSTISSVCI